MTSHQLYMRAALVALVGLVTVALPAEAQRRFEIHSRGMLHETVFNTGEIGRAYHQGGGGNATEVPMMEWPGNSRVTVDDIRYDGKHYTNGGGVYISAQLADSTDRVHSLSGGVGASQPDITVGRWAFPLTITRRENYPVLADGSLNPAYDPNEAEEIIVASWATPVGVTVTRTSRAWSFPDYDDLIIYEYEFEYTGDRDGDTIPDTDTPITDVTIAFSYGLAGNLFGNLRTYGSWTDDEYQDNDQRGRFDPLRFLNYTYHQTGLPDPVYYREWSETGENGGGLNAPGTPGYMMLHFDTEQLSLQGETLADVAQGDSAIVWTELYGGGVKVKQPWFVRQETSNLRASKLQNYLRVDTRKNAPLREGSVIPPEGGVDDPAYQHYLDYWVGAGRYNFRQTRWATGRITVFGPYQFSIGETARFALAELIGFGAVRQEQAYLPPRDRTSPEQDNYLVDWGGSCGEDCGEDGSRGFFPIASYADTVRYGGNPVFPSIFPYGPGADEGTVIKRHGSAYLSEYPLPDYVNSDVVTVREVADRAYFAYTGAEFAAPEYNRPEFNPEAGIYQMPIPVPAPALNVASDEQAQNVLYWSNAVESFSTPRLQGTFDHYEVARSTHPAGPWEVLARVDAGDPDFRHDGTTYGFVPEGDYVVLDPEPSVGETFYYSIVSVDENGRKSGRTNVTEFETQLGSVTELGEVYVVPNPFVVGSGFGGASESSLRIGFYGLPAQATIRIYSFAGQLVQTIEHDSPTYSVAYLQETRNDQRLASGVYFFVVTTPEGQSTRGKFVIIR